MPVRVQPGLPPVATSYDTQFYVGPLGGLLPLPGTESSVDTPLSVIGGTHTSLTGAFTRDRFGYKRSWTWSYPLLTERQARLVEALQRNMVPGPLYLIDPRRPNRLPEQIASGGSLMRTPTGFIPSNTTTALWRPLSYPAATASTLPASPILRGCLEWQILTPAQAFLELAGDASNGRHNVPVIPRETLEVSVWATGAPAATLTGGILLFDSAGTQLSALGLPSVALSLTTWRLTANAFVVPDGATHMRMYLSTSAATPAGSIYTTALQVSRYHPEFVSGLTQHCDDPDFGGWSLGGGAPQVVPDIGPSAYVRPGLQSSALTLIER
jgi:hypothetical protein